MATYRTFTTLGDFGPWVSKLILDLPCEVRADEVSPATFNVFCTRRETADGSVLMRTEKGADHATPSQGYAKVLAAHPCTEEGAPLPESAHVALEMGEVRVNKRIEGSVMRSRFVVNDYRVTQLAELPGTGRLARGRAERGRGRHPAGLRLLRAVLLALQAGLERGAAARAQ